MDALRDLLQGLTRFSDVGLLLMRLLVGFLFVYSGLGKYQKLRKFAEENGRRLDCPLADLLRSGGGGRCWRGGGTKLVSASAFRPYPATQASTRL